MTRDEEIKNMFPRRKEINDSMPLMSFGKSYTVNDSFEVGYVYGAQWADEHPSEETIEKVINLSRRWSIANEGTRTDYIKKHWNDENRNNRRD